jgi:hypothetical protein
MTGIIGTAGRDKAKPMTPALWRWMVNDAIERLDRSHEVHLVSGGAAWADHLAVWLFLDGLATGLTLHLPAPFDGTRFIGPQDSSASAANYYHREFSRVIGLDSLAMLDQAIEGGALITQEPSSNGYQGMIRRNAKVARDATTLIAYTFGRNKKPDNGGTADTWSKCMGERIHVPLPYLRGQTAKVNC